MVTMVNKAAIVCPRVLVLDAYGNVAAPTGGRWRMELTLGSAEEAGATPVRLILFACDPDGTPELSKQRLGLVSW
jgi:hypothetical protein